MISSDCDLERHLISSIMKIRRPSAIRVQKSKDTNWSNVLQSCLKLY